MPNYGLDSPLTYWRSQTKPEVDFILGDAMAVEVKSSEHVVESELKGIRALSEDLTLKRKIVIYREKSQRITDDSIEIWPVTEFLDALWGGKFKDQI